MINEGIPATVIIAIMMTITLIIETVNNNHLAIVVIKVTVLVAIFMISTITIIAINFVVEFAKKLFVKNLIQRKKNRTSTFYFYSFFFSCVLLVSIT